MSAINQLAVSGDPEAMAVATATAGSNPTAASSTSTTYSITTNQSGQKITGAVDRAMPAGTKLSLTLGAPSGASSGGQSALSTTPTDLVTGLTNVVSQGDGISYQFEATASAGSISTDTRTVVLTLTAGS